MANISDLQSRVPFFKNNLLRSLLSLFVALSLLKTCQAQTLNCRPSDYRSVFGDPSSQTVTDVSVAVQTSTGDFVVAGSFAANAGSFAYYHQANNNCAVIWKRQFSGLNLIRSVAFSSDGTKVLISASETASATSEVLIALDATSTDPFSKS